MTNKSLNLIAGRFLRGSAMASPYGSIILRFSLDTPISASVEKIRARLAGALAHFPASSHGSADPHATPGSEWTEALSLFADLVTAIQLEFGIPAARLTDNVFVQSADQKALVYLPAWEAKPAELAIQWSMDILNQMLSSDQQVDLEPAIEDARAKLELFHEPSINNFFTIRAAEELKIPINHPLPGLLVLGTGARSRWSNGLISDATSGLGIGFARAKHLTAKILRAAGLPGPTHKLAASKAEALQIAEELGFPVVVKPADADKGHGVHAGLIDQASVAAAFDLAMQVSPNVLVEKWVAGSTHRLTVQDGNVIRAVRRIAGGVTGDGIHTVRELIKIFEKEARQIRLARTTGRYPLSLDNEAEDLLRQQGLTADSRIQEGVYVRLRRRDNINAGGRNEELDFRDALKVHPDNVRLAIDAAHRLRLDFAGIDLITTDISRSWREHEALICEINAQPQMGGDHDLSLYTNLLRRMFPHGICIQTDLIIAPSDASIQGHIKDRILGIHPEASVALKQGLWSQSGELTRAFENSFDAARSLLQKPDVNHAVCIMTPIEIYQHGLPVPRLDTIMIEPENHYNEEERIALNLISPWLKKAANLQ